MKPNHMHTYKKIALLTFSVLIFMRAHTQTYTPSAHVQVNDAVAAAQATPLEARSMFFDGSNFLYRAFQSTSEVLSYLNTTASRTGNFIIIVDSGGTLQGNGTYLNPHNTYYMFADSTTSGQLKKMNLFGTGVGTCSGCLLVANNLSDLASLSQALINLNLNNVDNTSDAVKNAATVALTNHTIDGSLNTLTNIPNSALVNTSIGLTLNNTGARPLVTTTPAALGTSLVMTVPWTNGSDSGFLKGTDWTSFHNKVDSAVISNDSLYNCVNGTCTLQSVLAGTGAVNSVTGTNTSLLFSPSTGNVLGQVNPNYPFTWTAQHTFSGFAPIFSTLTTAGGLFYGSGTGQMLQSAGGTNGQILQSTGGGTAPIFFSPDATTVEGWLGFTPLTATLPSTNIFVGNGSNLAQARAMSGDATLSNTGVLTITKAFPDSAIWKSNAQYLAGHSLTMNGFTQDFAGGILHPDTVHVGSVAFNSATADTIVWMGTSITFGYTDTSIVVNNPWTTQATATLSQYQNYIEYNLGVPGTLLVTQIPNIPHKTPHRAWLALEFGSNELNDDLLDTAAFRATWIAFIDTAIARGWSPSQISIMSQQGSQLGVVGTVAEQRGFNYVDSTIALQFGTAYVDCFNPLITAPYYYISNIGVANIHPPIDAVPLFANLVAGVLSKSLQFQNIGQQLVVQNIGQIGQLVNKNIPYIAIPRYLAFDPEGHVGYGSQIPNQTRTQGVLQLGGGILGTGSQFGLQNSTVPPDWDSTKDWLVPFQAKLIQFAQTAVPYTSTFRLMYSDGNSYYQNNNPHGFFTLTAPAFVFNADSIIHFVGGTDFGGTINVENQSVISDYSSGPVNVFQLSENGTRNTYFRNAAGAGKTIFYVSLGIDNYPGTALTLFPSSSLTVAKTLASDTTAEEPSSQFTVGGGPTGIYFDKGSIPNVRMTTTQRDAIASPADGLHVYNTTTEQDEYYNGTTSRWGPVSAAGTLAHSIFTPTTGGTVNLVNRQYNIINPAGALLAVTLNLPSSPSNNDAVYIKFTQTITTVTYANGTVVDGITAPSAGGLVVLTYDSGTTSWY